LQKTLETLPRPEQGNKLYYDDGEVPGFAVRVTALGARSFVLNYHVKGRERRITIGNHPFMSLKDARDEAYELYSKIRKGNDPLSVKQNERQAQRDAQMMADLARDYFTFHANKNKRASSIRNDRQMVDSIILPKLGRIPVAAVTSRDVESLHASLRATPYRANRVLALLSTMFELAIKWQKEHPDKPVWRSDNPAAGVKKFHEEKREQWLNDEELARLTDALDSYANQDAANAIRLLLLSGARKNEVLSATWSQFDLSRRMWTKPSHHTKQQRTEHVPMSDAALEILSNMKARAGAEDVFLFPGRTRGDHLKDLKGDWKELCRAAKITGVRIHDLRHTYASHLVSDGVPLAVVGRLLGHTQSQTTERYAHFADSPLAAATNRFGTLLKRTKKATL
jgi:integrase